MSVHNTLAGSRCGPPAGAPPTPGARSSPGSPSSSSRSASAIAVPTSETTDADYRLGESGRADAWSQAAGLDAPDTENVLITARRGGPLDAPRPQVAAARACVSRLAAADGVARCRAAVERRPHGAARRGRARRRTTTTRRPPGGHRRGPGAHPGPRGPPGRRHDDRRGDRRRVGEDLASAEKISLPMTLMLMLLAFGALIAAGMPVLLAATSVAATIGMHGAALAPGARRADGQQHDRADRDGGRRRLLALLPQA